MIVNSSDNITAVSWGAVFAGAVGAAALSLALLVLGFAFGLSAISPWSGAGASAAAIGLGGIIWLTFTQLAASGLGGYLAGRLRVRWLDTPADEVYFRDTAHGFLSWAVATLLVATLVTATVGSAVSGGARAVAGVAGSAASGAAGAAGTMVEQAEGDASDMMDYFVDTLMRRGNQPAMQDDQGAEPRRELATILGRSLPELELSQQDAEYITQLVARETGLSPAQAESRVNEVVTNLREAVTTAQQAADEAREAAAWTSGWMFIALLCGAFFASFMAIFGGRQRDLP